VSGSASAGRSVVPSVTRNTLTSQIFSLDNPEDAQGKQKAYVLQCLRGSADRRELRGALVQIIVCIVQCVLIILRILLESIKFFATRALCVGYA
jgi:hypothetical protein